MIDTSLSYLRGFLNTALIARTQGVPPGVEIAPLPKDPDDNPKDNIFITLLNIEEDKIFKYPAEYRAKSGVPGTVELMNPEICLNLFVLISAQFKKDNYVNALKFISLVIAIFQGKFVFEGNDFSQAEKNQGLEKLILDFQSTSFDQNNQVWPTLGSKLVPFAIYKVRMIALVDTMAPAVSSTQEILGYDFALKNK